MQNEKKKYQKQALPSCIPLPEDIAWSAGFLEGEGNFGCMSGNDLRARIGAGQKQREPLDRLLRFFGGRVYALNGRPYHTWLLRGEPARRLALLLKPMMTSRRCEQIDRMLQSQFSVEHGSVERFQQRSDKQSKSKRRA